MAKKVPNVTLRSAESRRLGLLMDDAEKQEISAKWATEDRFKLLSLCEHYGIRENPNMFYELALELARELYPESKKPGRKTKWTNLNKGALVVEVERLMRPNDQAHGVDWACNQLIKLEPWASFIEAIEDGTRGSNQAEVLRKTYFEFRSDKWANVFRDVFKVYENEGGISEWKAQVSDFVRNPNPK